MYLMVSKSDYNDADYAYEIKETSEQVYRDVRKFFYENKLTLPLRIDEESGVEEDIIEELLDMDLIPYVENESIHTLVSVTFYKIEEKIEL